MRKINKCIRIIIAIALMISIVTLSYTNAFAESNYSNQNFIDGDIIFNASQMSTEKLELCGHSSDFIETIPEDVMNKIASSDKAITKTSYYKEISNNSYALELVPISKNEFIYRSSSNPSVINLCNDISPMSVSGIVDSGTLSVTTTMFAITDNIISHYVVISSFSWSTMPNYRGTDIFGVTRNYNTSVIPNTFGSSVSYYTQKYLLTANTGGVVSAPLGDPTITTNSYSNVCDEPLTGFVIKFPVPYDFIPGGMIAGTSSTAYIHYGLNGGCWYEGVVTQPSITPQYVNHWSTYFHQKRFKIGFYVSITIPFGASISIEQSDSYSDPMTDTILSIWGMNS